MKIAVRLVSDRGLWLGTKIHIRLFIKTLHGPRETGTVSVISDLGPAAVETLNRYIRILPQNGYGRRYNRGLFPGLKRSGLNAILGTKNGISNLPRREPNRFFLQMKG